MGKIFSDISEAEISMAIVEEFSNLVKEYSRSDVIIVGGGPCRPNSCLEAGSEGS